MAQNGSQGESSGYTCGGCSTTWRGVSRCHCSGCHETFAGLGLFDAHRRDVKGVGTCIPPETIFTTPKVGQPERLMFRVGGLWQSVETPTVRQPPRRAS